MKVVSLPPGTCTAASCPAPPRVSIYLPVHPRSRGTVRALLCVSALSLVQLTICNSASMCALPLLNNNVCDEATGLCPPASDCADCGSCADPCPGHRMSATCDPQMWATNNQDAATRATECLISMGSPSFAHAGQAVAELGTNINAALMDSIIAHPGSVKELDHLHSAFNLTADTTHLTEICGAIFSEHTRSGGNICGHKFPRWDLRSGRRAGYQVAHCKGIYDYAWQLNAIVDACVQSCISDPDKHCCYVPAVLAPYFPCCDTFDCCPDDSRRRRGRRAQGAAVAVTVQVEAKGNSGEELYRLQACLRTDGSKFQACFHEDSSDH